MDSLQFCCKKVTISLRFAFQGKMREAICDPFVLFLLVPVTASLLACCILGSDW
jgi:hypothetical protein